LEDVRIEIVPSAIKISPIAPIATGKVNPFGGGGFGQQQQQFGGGLFGQQQQQQFGGGLFGGGNNNNNNNNAITMDGDQNRATDRHIARRIVEAGIEELDEGWIGFGGEEEIEL